VVAARAGCSHKIHDAFTAKGYGRSYCINLAAELDVIRAKFETDAMQLVIRAKFELDVIRAKFVAALNNRTPDFSSEATIIEDLKTQSRTWFSSCSFKSSRRCTKCSCPCTSSGRNEM
jgi:hypothetical protein